MIDGLLDQWIGIFFISEELGDYNQLEDWYDHFSKIKLPSNMLEYESYIGVLHQQLKLVSLWTCALLTEFIDSTHLKSLMT